MNDGWRSQAGALDWQKRERESVVDERRKWPKTSIENRQAGCSTRQRRDSGPASLVQHSQSAGRKFPGFGQANRSPGIHGEEKALAGARVSVNN
jgi:hypothetical protein